MSSNNEISGSEERGIPGTTTRKKTRVRTFAIFAVVLMALVGVVGFSIVTVNRFTSLKVKEKAEARKARSDKLAESNNAVQGDLSNQMTKIQQDEAKARAASDAEAAAAASAAAASSLPTPAGARVATGVTGTSLPPSMRGGQDNAGTGNPNAGGVSTGDAIADRRLQGDVVMFPASDAKGTNPVNTLQDTIAALKGASQSNSGGGFGVSAGKKNALEDQLTPSTVTVGQAALLPDLDYLLKRGELIRCGLITRVVSTWPGAVKCTILQDVYSANGHTVLVRAGAQAIGEQRNSVIQGQARQFVLWDVIDDGKVEITLDSPAADSLGGSGIEASVDNHFMQRFGGAIMVSLIGDFGTALANRSVGGGTNTISLSGTSNAADSAVQEVLKNTINIPPTAYTNQGQVTNIFVARHVDMSNVYKVIRDE
ncbi:TrbI/VirB10 family protein [Paraburkholderia largidicola]|uniref:Type IV secretion system protein VirB10 n=1 Tax=Paraburkholderia largidicola TaxID=3014751 RepID=A0A7I8C5E4_9BURK|nr:TrbI/VirB10 family protein [Paraburkholderia sp. PGU16]BCF95418.1 hypothetical protein PPGU16_84850 [Paraburkholderia sp. PGU16]